MHVYTGEYLDLFNKYQVSYNINYEIVLDMNFCKYVKLFKDILNSLYKHKIVFHPLDMPTRLLYLYILDECDKQQFRKDIDELIIYLNNTQQPIIAQVPYHIDILYKWLKYKSNKQLRGPQVIYNFNEILLDLFIQTSSIHFFDYINWLLSIKKWPVKSYNIYDSLINNNQNKIIMACFDKLSNNCADVIKELEIINILIDYNDMIDIINIDINLQNKIMNNIRHTFVWNSITTLNTISKYVFNDELQSRIIQLESMECLDQLSR